MIKTRIFLSCGQQKHNEDKGVIQEQDIASELKRRLEQDLDFEVYVSVEKHTLDGFAEAILSNLERSEYYLMIDFRREKIILNDDQEEYRGSLFTHQELGIATYLKKKCLVFEELGVSKRDGIKGFVQCNPIQFDSREKLVEQIISEVKNEWHAGWRNELVMTRDQNESQIIQYTPNGPTTWYHITVNNYHDYKAAHECVAFLLSIKGSNIRDQGNRELIELKWEGMTVQAAIIPPGKSKSFDAFSVIHSTPGIVRISLDQFLVDTNIFDPLYSISVPGDYEMEFIVYSREFCAVRSKFNLHLGTNLNELSFKKIEQ